MTCTKQNALLHYSRTYTNVYIGIGSSCLYKGNLDRTIFIKSREAQSVQHWTTNLKVVGSSPTVGKHFSFCILSLSTRSWQVDWSHANEIKHGVHPMYIREWSFERKIAAVL